MTAVVIPKQSLFKAPEVCQIAGVQPYVLRSWETEFPDLGVSRRDGGQRVYRRSDVERVLRIKQLVFVEGLTLAGARRRLGEESGSAEPDGLPLEELFGRDARERLQHVRNGLREVLHILSQKPDGAGDGGRAESASTRGRRDRMEGGAAARSVKAARRARR